MPTRIQVLCAAWASLSIVAAMAQDKFQSRV